MKHFNIKKLFTVTAVLLCSMVANAHSFEVGGIYYNITNATTKTVAVTYKGNYSDSYSNEYTGSVVIPESVTYSGTVYSVTSIGYEAFYNCDGLTSITIPNSVTSIGSSAFNDCDGLTSITIPNSVTSIGSSAFYYCSRLTSITIPNSVTSIGSYAFWCCFRLTSITIPNSVTSIGSYAFYNCDGLTSITIPNSVITIGEEAFNECSNLNSVVIGNSVASIGNYAFYGCDIKKMIWFPPTRPSYNSSYNPSIGSAGIHYVPNNNYGFSNSIVLTNLSAMFEIDNIRYIPLDLKERTCIAVDYMGEENVSTVVINDVVTYNNKLSLTVKEVMPYCFYNKKNITDITIPNSVTSIGKYAFYGCSALANVGISNNAGITKFGNNAFEGCTSLTSIVIPNEVTSIEANAFKGCFGITSIESYATTPPTCGTNALYDIDKLNCTLYVPENCIEAYSNADQWSNFIFIENFATATEEYTVTFMVDGEVYKTVTVAYGAEIPTVETPTKEGYIFSGWSETPATMPAEDITITGYFTLSPDVELEKCATPIIAYNDNGLDITSETDGAEIHTKITCSDVGSYNDSRIDLSATYNITTYATKEGYQNSEAVTATLYWIAVSSDEGVTDVFEVEAMPVLVTCSNGTINICGGKEGAEVVVYTTSGVAVGNAIITNGNVAVSTGLAKGEIAVVSIAGKSIKVVLQ